MFCRESGQELKRQDVTEAVNGEGKWESGELYPEDMAVDGDGNLYVLLGGMGTVVLVFDSQGQQLFAVEESGSGRAYT